MKTITEFHNLQSRSELFVMTADCWLLTLIIKVWISEISWLSSSTMAGVERRERVGNCHPLNELIVMISMAESWVTPEEGEQRSRRSQNCYLSRNFVCNQVWHDPELACGCILSKVSEWRCRDVFVTSFTQDTGVLITYPECDAGQGVELKQNV